MIRFLDDLVLLREVNTIKGVKHKADELVKMYPDDVVVIRHISYIYRDRLCSVARAEATPLDGFVQLGDLADFLGCHKKIFRERLDFMRDSGFELFKSASPCGIHHIHIPDDMRELMHVYNPCILSLRDGKHIADMRLIGDIKVGFF